MAKRPNLPLSRMLRDLAPGDDATLHRIATMLAAGEVVTIMDTARLAHRIEPGAFQARDLAAAVRVAVAYGDLSGLLGCGYGAACPHCLGDHDGCTAATPRCSAARAGEVTS